MGLTQFSIENILSLLGALLAVLVFGRMAVKGRLTGCGLALVLVVAPVMAFAGELASAPLDVDPILSVINHAIGFVYLYFPKAAPIIQLACEIIASIATFFTLLTVFVSGCLKLPIVLARVKGANAFADKLQKLHDKVVPILKKLSIFNAQVKK